jgi:hypothetical protein
VVVPAVHRSSGMVAESAQGLPKMMLQVWWRNGGMVMRLQQAGGTTPACRAGRQRCARLLMIRQAPPTGSMSWGGC